jgi:hypothetical protein
VESCCAIALPADANMISAVNRFVTFIILPSGYHIARAYLLITLLLIGQNL